MRWLPGLLLLWSATASAHRPSDAYLTLVVEQDRMLGQWEIALRDVAALVPLDTNADRQLSWGELRGAQAQLSQVLVDSLHLQGDKNACQVTITDLLVNDRIDGRYAWFAVQIQCAETPRALDIDYRLLSALDPTHRGILVLSADAATHSAVLDPNAGPRHFELKKPSAWTAFRDYLKEGIWHIWIGYDHILFLLALLLPAVLRYEHGRWSGVPRLMPALKNVVTVVTAFTLAHSVTLTLAALGWVRLPGMLVETAIAVSVLLAALNNLRPVVQDARWVVAFGFGLIHGFGFASVLGELGLPEGARLVALVAFNLGVEVGQLAIVAVAVPIFFALRNTGFYRSGVRIAGSSVVAALAALWIAQRTGLLAA
ncbi:MAG: HupE/UreJ family protein [Panacagrimonas sp.]